MTTFCLLLVKKVMPAAALFFFSSPANGQNCGQCTYDQAGNRLVRSIYIGNTSTPRDDSRTEDSQPQNDNKMAGNIVHVSYLQEQSILVIEVLGMTDTDICEISVFNLAGNTVLRQRLSSVRSEISLNTLKDGIYIVCIEINGERRSWKIIKK